MKRYEDKTEEVEIDERPPSRSEKKRVHEALQKLIKDLAALRKAELQRLPLPDDLKEALLEAKTIESAPALNRHLKYVANILANHDFEAIQQDLKKHKKR